MTRYAVALWLRVLACKKVSCLIAIDKKPWKIIHIEFRKYWWIAPADISHLHITLPGNVIDMNTNKHLTDRW